ncbi:5'-methylthioadenosine/S-adenosylhomocysteine nucleosidase family protein [Aspergillus stella-maris]|uniref:5'-methylthioadenosine/S-adenosylhomocysteine nucleosidase family protein n=1 Tax=Aspergillus stella-maris TaxID=1810926 RepID=UPI003CCCEAA4
MPPPQPKYFLLTSAYTIGWICALPVEFSAARRMLDREHGLSELNPTHGSGDDNDYILGSVGEHNVVINCPAAGTSGQIRACQVAADMKSTIPWIRFVLLVGIGGGVPSPHDVRLGDVVVGTSVIPYSTGKYTDLGHEITGKSISPPKAVLSAVTKLEDYLQTSNLSQSLEMVATNFGPSRKSYSRPTEYRLYSNNFIHGPGCDCQKSLPQRSSAIIQRKPRPNDQIEIHHGCIGTGSSVMKNAGERDEIASMANIICVEMEAAGVMDTTQSIPIRGISDYAGGHKNDEWHPYAALAAAMYAKELLNSMSTILVSRCPLDVPGSELERYIRGAISSVHESLDRSNTTQQNDESLECSRHAMQILMERHDLIQQLLSPARDKLNDKSQANLSDVLERVALLEASQKQLRDSMARLGKQAEQHSRIARHSSHDVNGKN